MMIQGVYKGLTLKEVTFLDTNNDDQNEIVDAALKAAGETRSSLFGIQFRRYPDGSAIVTLHTD